MELSDFVDQFRPNETISLPGSRILKDEHLWKFPLGISGAVEPKNPCDT